MKRITIRNTNFGDVNQLQQLMRDVRPHFGVLEEGKILSQVETFQEGQFVAVDDETGKIIATLGTLIIPGNDYKLTDSWNTLTNEGDFTNHDPIYGKTLFQAFCLVDRKYEFQNVRARLYEIEKAFAQVKNLRRIRAGVPLKNYFYYCDRMTPGGYLTRVATGDLCDPRVEGAISQGFSILAVVPNYYKQENLSERFGMMAQYNCGY